jgi:Cu(I)/Ag(I) efflux system membrane fusion protein
MTTRLQGVLALALVGAAAGAVVALGAAGSDEGGDAAGHAHGAAARPAAGGGPVRLDAESARRIGITYAAARVQAMGATVRAVGNVTYDETRLSVVDPKIEGWVERLHVDFLGAPVRRGEPLMDVYSPMLVAAQEELVLARRLADRSAGGSAAAADRAAQLLESSRRRLRYLDVPAAVVAAVERSGVPRRTITLRAPASGVVVEKSVVAGMRVMPGMALYRIADLSRVWVEGEVFERDMGSVRRGQHARLTFEAFPGETFEARVAYLYPTLSAEARTGRVRLELDNPGGRIRPGMYASIELRPAEARRAVVVPRGAVHQTGERAVVFVRGADG